MRNSPKVMKSFVDENTKGITKSCEGSVVFVPLIGKSGWKG